MLATYSTSRIIFVLKRTTKSNKQTNTSGTRPSVWTVSDGCLKLICSLDTSAFSALEVLTITALYKFTYLQYTFGIQKQGCILARTDRNWTWRVAGGQKSDARSCDVGYSLQWSDGISPTWANELIHWDSCRCQLVLISVSFEICMYYSSIINHVAAYNYRATQLC